jgi:glycosyltransferase involved in cell wall biosynthesis
MARRLENIIEQLQMADAGVTRRILYVQFTDPAAYPPVEHSSSLLAERGWQVFILGTGTLGDLNLQLPIDDRMVLKKVGFVQAGWMQKLQYLLFFFLTLYWFWRWRPSWIYASDPLACPIVWLVKRIVQVKVIYHEHDSPSADQTKSWFLKSVLAFRRKLAKDAELCVLPQQARLTWFLETTKRTKPAFCVWNCPRLDEIVDKNSDRDRGLIIYYHGSITSARLPTQLIVAASRFKGAVRVQIAGYEVPGSIGYTEELIGLAAKKGGAYFIEALGTIPRRKDLLRSAAKAHVGLSLMPKQSEDLNMRQMVGASNKPFDYMACGLPLLVTNLPEWVSTFVTPGYALTCDPEDPDSIEAALRWYLDHPDERREMGRRCRDKIRQSWNYEMMFRDVLAELDNGCSHVVRGAMRD